VKKTRVLQRKDGAIFTWTPVLDVRQDMHAGWLYEFADGTQSLQLDRATKTEIDSATMTKREAALIEENARLREAVARLQAFPVAPIQDAPAYIALDETVPPAGVPVGADEAPIVLDPGEVPIVEPKPAKPRARGN
jgi:hypothetical protein